METFKTEERHSIYKSMAKGLIEINENTRDSLGRFVKGSKSNRRKDYTGQQFGYLTVLEMQYIMDKNGKSRAFARCQCICGNIVSRKIDTLKKSERPSCGCMRANIIQEKCRKDLTGKRFSRLFVQKMLWDNRPTKCICVCDCGATTEVIATQLTSGKTQSCGCLQRERTSNANEKDFSGLVTKHGVKLVEKARKSDRGCWEWLCLCPCGNSFIDIPARVIGGHRISCGCIKSSGERYTEMILKESGASYIAQFAFQDCIYKRHLKFDFAVFDKDEVCFLIEYDGEQHFRPIDWFGGDDSFKETKIRDEIKNKYCLDKNIPLLRLPYSLSKEEIRTQINYFLKKYCESVETAGLSQ